MIMPLEFTWDSEMSEGREHEQTMAQSMINNNYTTKALIQQNTSSQTEKGMRTR